MRVKELGVLSVTLPKFQSILIISEHRHMVPGELAAALVVDGVRVVGFVWGLRFGRVAMRVSWRFLRKGGVCFRCSRLGGGVSLLGRSALDSRLLCAVEGTTPADTHVGA